MLERVIDKCPLAGRLLVAEIYSEARRHAQRRKLGSDEEGSDQSIASSLMGSLRVPAAAVSSRQPVKGTCRPPAPGIRPGPRPGQVRHGQLQSASAGKSRPGAWSHPPLVSVANAGSAAVR